MSKEKKILTIDLDGALMYSRPFEEAHKLWFGIMSILLNDPKINEYAELEDYFPKVHEVMERYLGEVDSQTRLVFARNLFAMLTIGEVRESDLVKDFVAFLRKIKSKYKLALITTTPEPAVDPILQKVGCANLFDFIYKSKAGKHPSKAEQFGEFITQYGKPEFYIGNGDKDISNCHALGIKTISVSWVSAGKIKGDYDIKTVKELAKIL